MPNDARDEAARRLSAESLKLLEDFRERWQSGQPPAIEEALRSSEARSLDAASRRDLLVELIKVDLEQRWRASVEARTVIGSADSAEETERPALGDYAARYPELAGADGPPLALIETEYRVRHLWGDRPEHAVYLTAYPDQAERIKVSLSRVDGALSNEMNLSQDTPHAGPDAGGRCAGAVPPPPAVVRGAEHQRAEP